MSINSIPFCELLLPFLGTLLICAIGGLLSPLVVLKQRSYLGDTLAHIIFPGIVVGLFTAGIFHLDVWLCIMIGAFFTAIIGTYLSEWFLKKLSIPPDSAAIMSLSTFFAFGILLLVWTKQEAIDVETLLFGDILKLSSGNFILISVVFICILIIIAFYKTHWNAWLTDPEFAKIAGFKIKMLDMLFPIMITVAVLAGFLAVGGLMISALITLPAIFSKPRSAFSLGSISFSLILGICGFILAIAFYLPVGPVLILLGFLAILLRVLKGLYVR